MFCDCCHRNGVITTTGGIEIEFEPAYTSEEQSVALMSELFEVLNRNAVLHFPVDGVNQLKKWQVAGGRMPATIMPTPDAVPPRPSPRRLTNLVVGREVPSGRETT